MESALSRRRLLQAAGATAAVGTVGISLAEPSAAALPTPARADVGAVAFGFGLGQVTLLASRWKQNADRELAYLTYLDADRMLYTFRANVGLSTNGASPVGGWEAPNGELRGHAGGHLLSGLAQAYASTGDAAILGKSQYLVAELAKCQAASPNKGFHAGYLSAYPESFFDRLEAGTSVWAPFYTLHKIYQGLLDLYLLTGNAQALSVATAAADWVDWRSARWNSTQLANVLRVEFGGINDFLALLSQVVGNSKYLTTAARFDDANFYNPLADVRCGSTWPAPARATGRFRRTSSSSSSSTTATRSAGTPTASTSRRRTRSRTTSRTAPARSATPTTCSSSAGSCSSRTRPGSTSSSGTSGRC